MHTRLVHGSMVIAFLIAGCSAMNHGDTTQPATATSATEANPLLAPWAGPYGGVPPWDQGAPERLQTGARHRAAGTA